MRHFLRTKFLFLVLMLALLSSAQPAYAQSGAPCVSTNTIGDCITNIYKWSLGVGVLIALLMIIFAGYRYITAGGNAQSVTEAKELFYSAFVGLIILFGAVVILGTINPDLASPPALPPLP